MLLGSDSYSTGLASAFTSGPFPAEKPFVASMGVYVFSRDVLLDLLATDSGTTDFGREVIPSALGRYRAGVGSLLELLTAESALGDARAIRIQARLNWHIALLQLAHDVGVLDARGGHTLRVVTDPAAPAPPQ